MIAAGELCPMCGRADLEDDGRFPTLPVVCCPSCRLVSVVEDHRG